MRIADKRIIVDGTGVIAQGSLKIIGILGISSADNASCIITDIKGDVVYEVASAITGERYFPMSFANPAEAERLQCDVFTSMKYVILYLE